MKKFFAVGFVSLILIMSNMFAAVYAENRAGAMTFTLGGGYYYLADKRQMQNTGGPFAGIGYDFSNRWGIETLLGFFNTNYDNSVQDPRQINGTLFLIDGLYHFYQYKWFEPYVLAGVGVVGLNPNNNDAHNEGNVNAGIGAEFFIDKSIAFRLEGRDIYTIVGGKNDVMLDGAITFLLDLC